MSALPKRTWPPEAEPTAPQWLDWFLTCSRDQQERMVLNLMEQHHRAVRCVMEQHVERLAAER